VKSGLAVHAPIGNSEKIAEASKPAAAKENAEPLTGMPAAWEMFGFLLGSKTREEVFEPSFNDFKADYLKTRAARYRGKWAQRWLTLCFSLRLVAIFLEAVRLGLQSVAFRSLLLLVPPAIQTAVKQWWFGIGSSD
jgi:hypothetical protein